MRVFFFAGFLVCASLIGIALYFQYAQDMEPCPLCIFQRVTIMALGIIFLLAALHNPGQFWKKIYGTLIVLVSLIGIGLSGRHVWIQSLPEDQIPSCGPGLEFMMETLPLRDVISKVLTGSGECHDINWVFLGLTIPGWTCLLFILFALSGVTLIWKRQHDIGGSRL